MSSRNNPSVSSHRQTRQHLRSWRRHVGIEFHHPFAFWIGVVLLMTGVLLHVPEFFSMRPMGFRMIGMQMSREMLGGMAAILVGLGLSTYGLLPRLSALKTSARQGGGYYVHAMDNAKLMPAHWWLLFVLGVALIIDIMKPATLGFVLPGMRNEYGINTAQAATLPLVALTGTTIGSVLWGVLADRLGRRASILLAALFFVGTSICGFMPSFSWNLLMCFIMGLSAGGMLPIVYALMAEAVPAKKRGWLVILHGGLASVCGYLVASGLATLFEPQYTWRILWFFGLPTGALIILMNRWIPESPRFLLERGDEHGAQAVMSRFGIVLDPQRSSATPANNPRVPGGGTGISRLFRRPLAKYSFIIVLYGLGWGLVNWGFLTFLPTVLRDAGFQIGNASALLFYSALAAIPGTLLVAFLYGQWSSRKTMVLFAGLTSAVLLTFALLSPMLGTLSQTAIVLLGMALMVSSTAVISMLSPYAAEMYPTDLRGTGSGVAAASSKLGGMIGPPLIGSLLSASSSVLVPAIITAVPIGLAALVLWIGGLETRGRGLEHISGTLGIRPEA